MANGFPVRECESNERKGALKSTFRLTQKMTAYDYASADPQTHLVDRTIKFIPAGGQ